MTLTKKGYDSLKFRFLSHFAQWLNINKSVVLSLMPSESGVSNKFSLDDQVTVSVFLDAFSWSGF